jgi:dienelactone hydrolase
MRLLFPFLFSLALACAADLPAGRIIGRVVARDNPSQSYALYLPSSYTAAREWPVVFCFDPGARGRRPLEHFRDAAEKYGYILAGSNNSRNGLPYIEPAQAMWSDVSARFRIDPRRTYAAGFSGGARVVLSLALANSSIAGVIASGAAFSGTLPPKVPFLVFGAAGIEDFNYYELKTLERHLTGLGTPHRVVFFPGGHELLPAPFAAQAIEWFELRAMKSGLRPRDDAFLAEVRRKRLESAASEEAAGEPASAAAEYASLATDFDAPEYAAKAAGIARSKPFKRRLAVEREEDTQEQNMARTLVEAARGSGGSYRELVSRLRAQANAPQDSSERRVARRTLGLAFSFAGTQGATLLSGRRWADAAPWLEFQAAIRDNNPFLDWQLAGVRAHEGERKRASADAARALQKGMGYFLALASSRR